MMMPICDCCTEKVKDRGSIGLTGQPASPTWREVQAHKIPCLKKVRGVLVLRRQGNEEITGTQTHRQAGLRWTKLADGKTSAPQKLSVFIPYS